MGKLLAEAGKCYGKNIIGQYAEKLMVEIGKKYNSRTLRRMRLFYEIFSNSNWSQFATKLSWSHYVELLALKNDDERVYYFNQCIKFNIGRNELRNRIKNKEYERLSEETKQKLIEHQETRVTDLIKNPILIKNNGNKEEQISEKAL